MRLCTKCKQAVAREGKSTCAPCLQDQKLASERRRRARDPVKYWAASHVRYVKYRAASQNISFDICGDWVFEQVQRQCEECWYCQERLDFTPRAHGNAHRKSPSLDQVDPACGYTKDNIVVACMKCNRRKSDSRLEDLEVLMNGIRRHKSGS